MRIQPILIAFWLAIGAGAAVASLVARPRPTVVCGLDADCPCGSHCVNASPFYNACGQIAGYEGGACVSDCNDIGTECIR